MMGGTQPCFQELALGLPTSSTLSKLQPFSLPTPVPLKLVSSLLCHPSASCFCMSSLRPADHCSTPGVPSTSGSPGSWDFWSRGRDETPSRPALQSTQGPSGQPEAGSGLGLKGSRSRPAGHPCLWPDPRAPVFLLRAFLQLSPESWATSSSPLALDGLQPQQPLPHQGWRQVKRRQSLQAFSLCLAQLARLSRALPAGPHPPRELTPWAAELLHPTPQPNPAPPPTLPQGCASASILRRTSLASPASLPPCVLHVTLLGPPALAGQSQMRSEAPAHPPASSRPHLTTHWRGLTDTCREPVPCSSPSQL